MNAAPRLVAASLLLALCAAPARAVDVEEVVATAGGTLWRSRYGEVHFLPTGGGTSRIACRLPRTARPLASDGVTAWSLVPAGADGAARLVSLRGDAAGTVALPTGASVGWMVAGSDGRWVYFRGGGRVEVATGTAETHHAPSRPCFRVEATVATADGHWLAAVEGDRAGEARLVAPGGREVGLSLGPVERLRLAVGDGVAVVASPKAFAVLDAATLEPRVTGRFDVRAVVPPALVVQAGAAWAAFDVPGRPPGAHRLDLATGEVTTAAWPLPTPRHRLVAGDGRLLWMGRISGSAPAAPEGIDPATGATVRVNLEGPPGSGWRAFGRGLRTGVLVATAPVWFTGAAIIMAAPGQ